jgi:hypothetical protein
VVLGGRLIAFIGIARVPRERLQKKLESLDPKTYIVVNHEIDREMNLLGNTTGKERGRSRQPSPGSQHH